MEAGINLEFILVSITFLSGLIIFIHFLMRYGKPKQSRIDNPILVDYAKSFFPVLLIVILLRSFVAEPFRIPSGSMIPTLEVGDFILVKKYSYGIRLPVVHKKIISVGEPQRGDVVVFRYPPQPEINYIKRLIGLPEDKVEWTLDKELIINGKKISYQKNGLHKTKNNIGTEINVNLIKESLTNKPHDLILFSGPTRPGKWTVPEGHYFMMGDNRDNSSDSRFWGFVPEENLVGKASLVWMHWNWQENGEGLQLSRIGKAVN